MKAAHDPAERSDVELIAEVRTGDLTAYGRLWRRHEAAARRFAHQLTRPCNVDDLVSESFCRILRSIKSGYGPDGPFRPYLFSAMRRYVIDSARQDRRIMLTGNDEDLEHGLTPAADELVAETVEQQAAVAAWQSLPDSSRTLLWHLLIEEETPARIAPLLGTTPNGVSSRAVRAKERLRQAFLTQHASAGGDPRCQPVRDRLGGYVRGAVSSRDRADIEDHLRRCADCPAVLGELADLNTTLRAAVAPALVGDGALAARYLAGRRGHQEGTGAGPGRSGRPPGGGRWPRTLQLSKTAALALALTAAAGSALTTAALVAPAGQPLPAPTSTARLADAGALEVPVGRLPDRFTVRSLRIG